MRVAVITSDNTVGMYITTAQAETKSVGCKFGSCKPRNAVLYCSISFIVICTGLEFYTWILTLFESTSNLENALGLLSHQLNHHFIYFGALLVLLESSITHRSACSLNMPWGWIIFERASSATVAGRSWAEEDLCSWIVKGCSVCLSCKWLISALLCNKSWGIYSFIFWTSESVCSFLRTPFEHSRFFTITRYTEDVL